MNMFALRVVTRQLNTRAHAHRSDQFDARREQLGIIVGTIARHYMSRRTRGNTVRGVCAKK